MRQWNTDNQYVPAKEDTVSKQSFRCDEIILDLHQEEGLLAECRA